ncbi:Glycogen synthase [Baekduia alba]|uniref:glycosyltransferase family 4 protein n=1 Tax=Baekduia alba TaxID=2997333 RepID=UPI002340F03A|nr:glycosyltransferase family 4 protein [Baekduia alba]WCB92473.1 Glycogen synthase [Baekduia alba]
MTPVTSPGRSSRTPRRDGIPATSSLPSTVPAPLRIAMLAPPWIAVPPPGYGGVESVVSALTEALVALGHDVTLFCAPGSVSAARVTPLLDVAHPHEIERALYESDHVARAFAAIEPHDGARAFDVVHDHSGFTALALADRLDTPFVHTLHGPFDPGTGPFYAGHGRKAALVAISAAQLRSAPNGVVADAIIRNPVDVAAWPLRETKDEYLLWVGRMNAEKGPHRAIAAAREAGVPLVLAGVIQPGQEAFFAAEVAPHVDGDRVRFVGEVGGATKRALFAGARGLLMPIRWAEPFGMVMIEALACGTPVVAFGEGAAPEVVVDGVTGFLVADEGEMAAAVARLPALSARACRDWVVDHCDAAVIASAYAELYTSVAAHPVVPAAARG